MHLDIPAEIERRLQLIQDRYPDRFDDDALKSIRLNIERSVTAAEALRACDLANEIDPHFDPRAMSRV